MLGLARFIQMISSKLYRSIQFSHGPEPHPACGRRSDFPTRNDGILSLAVFHANRSKFSHEFRRTIHGTKLGRILRSHGSGSD